MCGIKDHPKLKIPSSRKTKIFKKKILRMLSANLKIFFPQLKSHFMCPVCLTPIPLEKQEKISEAHIIPKATAGKLKTYLCDECNSLFGRRQDKWFGEFLKIVKKDEPSILYTDIKEGRFRIDDVVVNGTWKVGDKNDLVFYIHQDRNPPSVINILLKKFKSHPPRISLQVAFPIMGQKKLVEIGFLTAGYLMWFGTLGYSWVLQEHLDPIREQILNPEKNIIDTRFIAYCKGIRWKPWIGLVTVAEEIFLAMGLENSLVLFPPADRPQIYSKLERDLSYNIGRDIRPIQFWSEPFYGPSILVMFDDRIMVVPNAEHDFNSSLVIQFTSDSVEGRILQPINNKNADQVAKNAIRIKPDFSPHLKKWKIKNSL